jgi:hypothetical protein
MYFQYKYSYQIQQDVGRHYNQSQSSERKYSLLLQKSHYSLVGLRNIYTSIAKKHEAHARHDVSVLPCYAGANNYRLSW